MLVTYPFRPTRRRARASAASSGGPGTVRGLDEPRRPGGPPPCDDLLGAVLLQREGPAVTHRSLGRVGPDRPPRTGLHARVPHRFGPDLGVVLDGPRGSRGDGVDDLPVDEGVAVPMEVGLQVDR